MEFPHLMQLVDNNQFDTIYHEHFSYLSFHTVKKIFESRGSNYLMWKKYLRMEVHYESMPVIRKTRKDNISKCRSVIKKGRGQRDTELEYYENFQEKALKVKLDFLEFLTNQKKLGKR